jgi:hypothetical protein
VASLPRLLRRNDHPDASLVGQTHMEPTDVEEKQKGQKGKKTVIKAAVKAAKKAAKKAFKGIDTETKKHRLNVKSSVAKLSLEPLATLLRRCPLRRLGPAHLRLRPPL